MHRRMSVPSIMLMFEEASNHGWMSRPQTVVPRAEHVSVPLLAKIDTMVYALLSGEEWRCTG